MQLRGGKKKKNPLLTALLLSADIMKGRSLNNGLITSSTRQTTRRHNRLPVLQILLGWRKQYQEMHMLGRKLDTSCLIFCGCYSASIRRRGWRTLSVCLLCGSVLMCALTKAAARDDGFARIKDEGRIFNSSAGLLQTKKGSCTVVWFVWKKYENCSLLWYSRKEI